tara:strand:+ start:845 stop:1162 length:318 start_codon:yes stop_codon:yes gene_type:complete
MNPFDAAWALLKQWDDTDWGFTADPPATADPWADVDWTNMTMGPDGKPYSTKTDPMMADLSREGGMERWLNRQISPSPIPHDELYARYLAQRQGATPSTGAIGQP